MSTILLPTDFSGTASNAARYVSHLLGKLGITRMILYHSYKDSDMTIPTDILSPSTAKQNELHRKAWDNLNELKEDLQQLIPPQTLIECQTDNRSLIQAVTELVKQEDISLVVIGIKEGADPDKNSISRNTTGLIKEHTFPLLIIPERAVMSDIKRVMLACDLKSIRESLPSGQLKSLLRQLQAKLVVVNVDYKETAGAVKFIEEETALHQLLDGVQPEFHYISQKHTVEALIQFTKDNDIDLMVSLPKQRGWVEQLFHDRATQKLALKTDQPLLILHKQSN